MSHLTPLLDEIESRAVRTAAETDLRYVGRALHALKVTFGGCFKDHPSTCSCGPCCARSALEALEGQLVKRAGGMVNELRAAAEKVREEWDRSNKAGLIETSPGLDTALFDMAALLGVNEYAAEEKLYDVPGAKKGGA
jgi:hypothetical protein